MRETPVFHMLLRDMNPPYCIRHRHGTFIELDAKGLLLGVHPNVIYEEQSVVLEEGDFIAMMTDGVTEVRTETGFIDDQSD